MNPKMEERLNTPIGPSFGEGGVSIIDVVHSENFRMDWTIHPYQKILLIVDGSGYIEDGTFAWPIKKGVVVYVPDNWRYRVTDTPGEPVSLFILFLKTEIFGTHKEIGFEKRPLLFSKEAFAQGGLERMRHLFYEQSANLPGSQEILRGMAWRFLGEIKRAHLRSLPEDVPVDPSRSNEVRVQHFLSELHENFFRPVSLEGTAKRLVMSKRTLTSIFRKLTGTSLLNYIQELRIQHAKKLLEESNRSVITISFECGFDNLSNFYRTFKKLTRCSPNEVRIRSRSRNHASD
jgi:AraC-like DNA-binding protein